MYPAVGHSQKHLQNTELDQQFYQETERCLNRDPSLLSVSLRGTIHNDERIVYTPCVYSFQCFLSLFPKYMLSQGPPFHSVKRLLLLL